MQQIYRDPGVTSGSVRKGIPEVCPPGAQLTLPGCPGRLGAAVFLTERRCCRAVRPGSCFLRFHCGLEVHTRLSSSFPASVCNIMFTVAVSLLHPRGAVVPHRGLVLAEPTPQLTQPLCST